MIFEPLNGYQIGTLKVWILYMSLCCDLNWCQHTARKGHWLGLQKKGPSRDRYLHKLQNRICLALAALVLVDWNFNCQPVDFNVTWFEISADLPFHNLHPSESTSAFWLNQATLKKDVGLWSSSQRHLLHLFCILHPSAWHVIGNYRGTKKGNRLMANKIFRLALGEAIFLPYGNAVRYVLKEGNFKRWLDDAVFVKG